ncbi:MAG: DUF2802 domain-containing protein [Zoogloeaceae bacterium]|jgi:hypothetical protein|nr:DUF2802 domain-containing protein [Zoogloeaceae bacterium]
MAWREALLGLILLIVAYMVWLLWRMRALSRKSRKPPAREFREPVADASPKKNAPPKTGANMATKTEPQIAPRVVRPRPVSDRRTTLQQAYAAEPEDEEPEDPRQADFSAPGFAADDIAGIPPKAGDAPVWSVADAVGLAQQAFMHGVEREIAQVHDEIDALRGALANLREDIALLRENFQQEVSANRVAQGTSPLYNDAMQMAMLGHDATTISERCGISRAEADLVTALVKGPRSENSSTPQAQS